MSTEEEPAYTGTRSEALRDLLKMDKEQFTELVNRDYPPAPEMELLSGRFTLGTNVMLLAVVDTLVEIRETLVKVESKLDMLATLPE